MRTRTPASTPTQFTRPFSSTPQPQRQTPSYLTVPEDKVPEYPYGPFRTYKKANQGLFGGAKKRFGNTVAEKYGRKSPTSWLPNVHVKRLWSKALGDFIRTRLTAQVLRTIDRLGGIDEYLLGAKSNRIRKLGPAGWALRWKIMQTPAVRARFARERQALGLPPKEGDDVAGDAVVMIPGGRGKKTTSGTVLEMVDGMMARDEEFVLEEEGPREDTSRKTNKKKKASRAAGQRARAELRLAQKAAAEEKKISMVEQKLEPAAEQRLEPAAEQKLEAAAEAEAGVKKATLAKQSSAEVKTELTVEELWAAAEPKARTKKPTRAKQSSAEAETELTAEQKLWAAAEADKKSRSRG